MKETRNHAESYWGFRSQSAMVDRILTRVWGVHGHEESARREDEASEQTRRKARSVQLVKGGKIDDRLENYFGGLVEGLLDEQRKFITALTQVKRKAAETDGLLPDDVSFLIKDAEGCCDEVRMFVEDKKYDKYLDQLDLAPSSHLTTVLHGFLRRRYESDMQVMIGYVNRLSIAISDMKREIWRRTRPA